MQHEVNTFLMGAVDIAWSGLESIGIVLTTENARTVVIASTVESPL